MIPEDVWDDQDAFNQLIRSAPYEQGESVMKEFMRDMVLNLMSEADELLRTTSWKSHRQQVHRPNREHRLEELIDIFKIWLTTVQGLGYTPEEIRQAYWRKSMVVRQRHSEEWVKKLDKPAWVLDIDNVLCDYTTGFCTWLKHRAPLFADAAQAIIDGRKFFSSEKDFGMTATEWQGFKHEFRSMGHKRQLPVMPGAREFTLELKHAGYAVILLTSRPIDRYPNIYTDTLWWLHSHGIEFDWVWWATDKGERLIENGGLKYIRGVVDDDPRYIQQFQKLGLPCWWVRTTQHPTEIPWVQKANVRVVKGLHEIVIEPVGTGVH